MKQNIRMFIAYTLLIVISSLSLFLIHNFDQNDNDKNKSFIHISFDDVTLSFKNLSENNYISVFDEPFFKQLKIMHFKYGAKFSIFTYTNVLKTVPENYKIELMLASNWLKFGFHSVSSGFSLKNSSYDDGLTYWNDFAKEIKRICGSLKSLDRIPRLEFFEGSKECLLGMRDADYGALGFLSADDDRLSYYFDEKDINTLFYSDYLIDEVNNFTFVTTDIRCEWFSNFSTINNYRKPIKDNVYEELVYRINDSSYDGSTNNLIVFTHENFVYNGKNIKNEFKYIEQALRFALDYNISFNYAYKYDYKKNI